MSNQNDAIYSSSQRSNKVGPIVNIFLPSSLGMSIYVVIFIISIVVGQPSEYKQALQSFNAQSLQGTFAYHWFTHINKIISSQIVSEIAIYVFWVIIACVIYLIAYRLIKNVDELAEDLSLREYIWPQNRDKNAPLKDFIEKLVFHTVLLILIVVYMFKAIPLIVRFWKRSDLKLAFSLHALTMLLLLFVFETLFLHLAVILVRLFLTRKRII